MNIAETLTGQVKNPWEKEPFHHPFSFLVATGMIQYRPEGTKLGWNGRHISFYSPSIFQGAIRKVSKEGGEEIPFERMASLAVFYYHDSKDETVGKVFTLAAEGLEKLKDVYVLNNKAIGEQINTAQTILMERKIEGKKPCLTENQKKVKEVWELSIKAVEALFSVLKNANSHIHAHSQSEKDHLLLAIDSLMKAADDRAFHIVEKLSKEVIEREGYELKNESNKNEKKKN